MTEPDQFRSGDRGDPEGMWSSLGGIAHGPVVLARAPHIVIAVRCVMAFPEGLRAWLVADTTDINLIPPAPSPPANHTEAAQRMHEWEQWPGPADDPVVHVTVNGHRRRMLMLDGRSDDADPGAKHIDVPVRIDGLPRDGLVHFEVSWKPGLPLTSKTLHLPQLQQALTEVRHLVHSAWDSGRQVPKSS